MFQFPGLDLPEGSDGCFHPPGCPIRISVDHRMRAPPHGFSQLATSFLACPRLGIPRAPLPRLASSISTRTSPPRAPPNSARLFPNPTCQIAVTALDAELWSL